jgi:Ca-activated chloride channel family protein
MVHRQTVPPSSPSAGLSLQLSQRERTGRMQAACWRVSVAAIPLLLWLLLAAACAPAVTQHNNAGNEFFETGSYDEALSEYRQAQVSDPDTAEPYYNAANALNRQGNLPGVQAQTGQALKSADPNLSAQAWYNMGNAFFDAEDWEQAIAAYQEALRINPHDQDAKRNLELALDKLREAQQQEQDRQEQEQEQGEQSGEPESSPETSATPTPQGEEGTEAGQPPEQPDQGTPNPNQGTDSLTPEQARQMLEALVGDSETLQERLQKVFVVPGRPPERDW